MFLLPTYLLSLALGVRERRDRIVLAAVLALNLTGVSFYFAQYGYLNLGYLVPYGEMAQRIEEQSPPADTLVLVDAYNGDPKPLVAALGPLYQLVVAQDAAFVRELDTQLLDRDPATVWRLGSARDVSPGGLNESARQRLEIGYQLTESSAFLPYNSLQRSLFELFSNEEAPEAHYTMERWDRRAVQAPVP